METAETPPEPVAAAQTALSYKFQRLRERLREAIAGGEFSGKLPGERELAKRFHVNAKTLSKALTDLAAEGLLDRSIGRGTFVKGSAPAIATAKRWLVVCDPVQAGWGIVELLRHAHSELDILSDVSAVRPSFLNQFSAVIVLIDVPDAFIRDLVVRNVPVVVVGREPKTFSTHAVLFDAPLAVSLIGRDLLLSGHCRLAAVEPPQCTVVVKTLQRTVLRYDPAATVDPCLPSDALAMVNAGVTAFVCHTVKLAWQVKVTLEQNGVAVPNQVSVVAIGSTADDRPVSGYFMNRSEKANAVAMLLQQNSIRPTTIWLAGAFVDRGTMGPPPHLPFLDELAGTHKAI